MFTVAPIGSTKLQVPSPIPAALQTRIVTGSVAELEQVVNAKIGDSLILFM